MKEPLVAAASFTLSQFINKRVSPTPFELCEIGVYQNEALSSFFLRTRGVPAGFGGHARQGLQLSVGVASEVSFPSSSVLAIKPIPPTVQRGVRGLPGLVVNIRSANSRNVIVHVSEVGKLRAIRN